MKAHKGMGRSGHHIFGKVGSAHNAHGNTSFPQKSLGLFLEPAFVAEFQGIRKSGIELIEDAQKEIAVVPKAWRKLKKKTAEFFPKDLAHGIKPAQKLLGSLEFSEVRNSPKGFEGEKEASGPFRYQAFTIFSVGKR